MHFPWILPLLASSVFGASEYKLVWSDEFESTGLPDATKWYYDVGGWGWGNNELQYYKKENPRNSWVDSGTLKITVRREDTSYTDWRGGTSSNHLSSARINTYDRKLWTYGKFEARMKLPRGAGMWPAFWVVPPAGSPYGQWPACGEIDILESYGAEPGVIHGSVHTKNRYGATSVNSYSVVEQVSDSFHLYTLDWKPDTIAISVDGKEFFRYNNPHTGFADWPFDQPAFLILNVAVNGAWETVDTTALPQRMEVDYVRVYQMSETSEAVRPHPHSLSRSPATVRQGRLIVPDLERGTVRLTDLQGRVAASVEVRRGVGQVPPLRSGIYELGGDRSGLVQILP